MANVTKTCNLTEDEIESVIKLHANHLLRGDSPEYVMERMNYFTKRLKAFKEPETETETKPTPAVAGWGTPTT